jgi:hypothetical protein
MSLRRYRTQWFIVSRRGHNRWLDLRGRLAGYCMATTWRQDTGHGPGYSPGYSHWRCWRKRHPATEPHRYINYVWTDDGPSDYDPLPIHATETGSLELPPAGNPPRWGRHHVLSTRRRDRARARYAATHGGKPRKARA